jgi:YspA, cpYpsA-related SLOG family
MRILVTGSRDWRDEKYVHEAIDTIITAEGKQPSQVTVVHGDCPTGADQHAASWAARRLAGTDEHPANWREFGQGAGFKRNVEMVESGVDICLAFIRPCISEHCQIVEVHGSHGSTHCSKVAQANRVPTTVYRSGW